MADLIQATALKRAIAESCALPEWVRALVNCVIDDQETVDADAAVPYGGLSMDEKDVTDKNVGKSADEMFRKLGYECNHCEIGVYCIRPDMVDDNGLWTYTEIIIGSEEVIKQTQCEPERAVYEQYLSPEEVLACAQMIREMEAQEDG